VAVAEPVVAEPVVAVAVAEPAVAAAEGSGSGGGTGGLIALVRVQAAASQVAGLIGLGRPAVVSRSAGAEAPGRSPQRRGYRRSPVCCGAS
jgi:hypothetical protein